MPVDKVPTGFKTKTWLRRLRGSSTKLKRAPFIEKHPYTGSDSDDDFNMGKSNKFDYTNRPNSGAKLGQIIGGALQKEAEKVKKDAERHIHKARKQSTDSSSGTADANSTTHIIDLKAPSKDLGDDGVCALVDGLEIGLKSGTSEASLALEDLNLSGNRITTRSLARLAPVIELAKYDLKTLNLADNKIKVENDEEAAQWESFLLSFKDCMKLRRLDLSCNRELGARAMEVFARVHISEQPVNPIPPGGGTSTLSLISEHDDSEHELLPHHTEETDGHGIEFNQTMINARVIKRRCALRSIPYITLHKIGLDDAGALWLSYVLEDHHYPIQLIDELNATHPDSPIKTYQQDANFQGLDWTENKTLGKEGSQLLEKTDAFRRQVMLDDRVTLRSTSMDDADSVLGYGDNERRASMEQGQSKVRTGSRRVSVRSIRTTDGGEHEATELESARKKLKRYIIAHDGASSVELWHSAMKFFRASRIILYVSPTNRKHYTGPPLFKVPSMQELTSEQHPVVTGNGELQIETARAGSQASANRVSYAAKLVASPNVADESEFAITEVTNTPVTPMILQKPTHRKGGFSESPDYFNTVTEKLNGLVVRDQDPLRFIRYQQRRLAKASSEGREFRDPCMPCHLPKHVMEYILSFLMTGREIGVMSDEQKTAALEWGQSRKTLMTEREWLKKDESAQVLMLLDSINCLAYCQ